MIPKKTDRVSQISIRYEEDIFASSLLLLAKFF